MPPRSKLPEGCVRLFADRMRSVALIVANVLNHFGVCQKLELHGERPRFCVGLGIVDDDFRVHVTEIAAAEAFDGTKSLRMRAAAIVEPAFVVEPARVNYEPV